MKQFFQILLNHLYIKKHKIIIMFLMSVLILFSCSDSKSGSKSKPTDKDSESFAVRMPASATKIDNNGTISGNWLFKMFYKNAYADDFVYFPGFTFSTEDNHGDSVCSQMDYYSPSWNKLSLTPISDLDSNGTKIIKLVKNKVYHFFISGYITSTDGIHFCSSSSGAQSCNKIDVCDFSGIFVTGDWNFTVSNSGNSQIEVLSQTSSGNVYIRATNSGTDTCTITATGKALDPSCSDGTVISISISKNFQVVDEDSTTPVVTKIEFSGLELPLNELVEIDFNNLTCYATGEQPEGYDTSAPSDCSSGDCVPYKVYGNNITNCRWTTPQGTLGGTGVEYYWRASTVDDVFGVLVSIINNDSVLIQDKILIKKNQ